VLDPLDVDRLLAANRYLVLATADEDGRPWATPVFFAPLDSHTLCWVSAPNSRHSRNIAARPGIAITVFDSTVEVGQGEAAYFDADAAAATPDEVEAGLRVLNRRLPEHKRLIRADLQPAGALVVYQADLRRRHLLVRGGNAEFGNEIDMTVEV
jgi:uncharacterized protein YhbP (UPF0306 family)